MLVIGSGGFAIQLFDVLHQLQLDDEICFYNDLKKIDSVKFLNKYKILRTESEAKAYLENKESATVLGIGKPSLRKFFYNKFSSLGSDFKSIISPVATLGSELVEIGKGTCILSHSVIESTCKIGVGCLINLGVHITHGVSIGDFCEVSPSVNLLGNVQVLEETFIGTGSVVLPRVTIGRNCIIGAGSIVTKNVPDYSVMVGNPARIIKPNVL